MKLSCKKYSIERNLNSFLLLSRKLFRRLKCPLILNIYVNIKYKYYFMMYYIYYICIKHII